MADVGGRLGRDERGKARKTTQRVNTARWGLQEPVPGEERGGDPPTSRNDSLVADAWDYSHWANITRISKKMSLPHAVRVFLAIVVVVVV